MKGTQASQPRRDFQPGSIVKVILTNFLTYENITFKMNPRLNVIIGPNGAGKSSVVCAINIGLAGKIANLSRAKELVDYIKHGEDEAKIDIRLCNPESENKVDSIVRILKRGAKHKCISTFFLNNIQVSQRNVEDHVGRAKVNLGNLCQFLPQERVADFAKMSKIELLNNTEEAVCTEEMRADRRWLSEFRRSEKGELSRKEQMEQHLATLKQLNHRLEHDVRRFKNRKNMAETLRLLQSRKITIEYNNSRKEFDEKREEYAKFAAAAEKAKKDLLPFDLKVESYVAERKSFDGRHHEIGVQRNKLAAELGRMRDEQTENVESHNDVFRTFEQLKKEEEEKQKKMEDMQLIIESWREELSELDDSHVQPDIDKLERSKNENHRVIQELLTQVGEAENHQMRIFSSIKEEEKKLVALHNMGKRRLEFMQRRNRDCYKAVQWLRSNKHLFRKTIHEPIMLIINVKDGKYAEILENHIAQRDMFAFVCEDPQDNQKFIKIVREELKIKINVVLAPRDQSGNPLNRNHYHPRRNLTDLSQYGFVSYMRELFDAPEAVMAYLCKQYRVHAIPVGSSHTKQIIDKVTSVCNLDLFFIPSHTSGQHHQKGCRYSVKKSKYSGNSVVGNSSMRAAEFLNTNVDTEQISACENVIKELKGKSDEMKRKIEELRAKNRKHEMLDESFRHQLKQLFLLKNKRKNLENKINVKKLNLEEMKKNKLNLEEEQKRRKESTKQFSLNRMKLAIKFQQRLAQMLELEEEKCCLMLRRAELITKEKRLRSRIDRQKCRARDGVERSERAKQAMEELKNRTRQKLKEKHTIEKSIKESMERQQIPQSEIRKMLAELPTELCEVEVKITEMETKLECCKDVSDAAFQQMYQEFLQREREIGKLKRQLEGLTHSIANRMEEMNEIKQRWLQPMTQLVSKVNERFSKYFAEMGCAGEVDLHSDDPEDFERYGIRIRVKFRASSELQELDPYRQSGGERSVSTMLYLIALQNVSHSPFRLVDEINQGMDPHNEKRVFEVIARCADEPNSSQYFLITPKLLHSLWYGESLTVTCLYNSANNPPSKLWNSSRFFRRRARYDYSDS